MKNLIHKFFCGFTSLGLLSSLYSYDIITPGNFSHNFNSDLILNLNSNLITLTSITQDVSPNPPFATTYGTINANNSILISGNIGTGTDRIETLNVNSLSTIVNGSISFISTTNVASSALLSLNNTNLNGSVNNLGTVTLDDSTISGTLTNTNGTVIANNGSIISGNVVNGSGSTNSTLTLDNSIISGKLTNTNGTVTLNNDSQINNGLTNSDLVSLNSGSDITGNVINDVNGTLIVGDGTNVSTITGDVTNSNILTVKKDSYVTGTLINNGTTTLQDGAYVSGMIANDGILNLSNVSLNTITGSGILNSTLDYTSVKTIGTNTTAQNKLNITSGTFTLSEDAYIDTTDVSSGTSLVINNVKTLNGDVNNVNGTVSLNSGSINGNVNSSGAVTLDDSTINGTLTNTSGSLIANNGSVITGDILNGTASAIGTVTLDDSTISGTLTNTNGTVIANNGSIISGNVVNGSGSTNSTLTLDNSIISGKLTNTNGTVTLNNDSQINNGLTNSDLISLNSGSDITGNVINDVNGTLIVGDGTNVSTITGDVTNSNILTVKKDSYVTGTLINNGTTTLQDGAYVSGMIANDGILNLSNVSLNTITGSGILNSTLDYTSVKTIGTNTTAQNKLNITSGTFTLSEDAYIDTTDVSSGTSLVINNVKTLNGDVNNVNGTVSLNSGSINGNVNSSGAVTLDDSTINGTLTNTSGSLIANNGSVITGDILNGTASAIGTVTLDDSTISGTLTNTNGTVIANNGSIISGNVVNGSGSTNSTLTLDNSIISGKLTNTNGTVTLNNDSQINNGLTNSDLISLNSGSDITGNVINDVNGTLIVGDGTNVSTITGDVTNSNILTVKKDSYVTGTLINNGTTTLQDGAYVSGMIANDGILNLSNVSLNTITGSGILNSTLDYTSVKTIGTNTTAQNKLNITSGTFTLSEDAYIDTTDVSSGTSLVINNVKTLNGDVNNVNGTVSLNSGSINGNVNSSGAVTLDDSTINGTLTNTSGSLIANNGSVITGDILNGTASAIGTVTLDDSTISGTLTNTNGTVIANNGSIISGNVVNGSGSTNSTLTLDNSIISGKLTNTNGTVTLNNDSQINNGLTNSDLVSLNSGSDITGNVINDVNGTLIVGDGTNVSTITGDVTNSNILTVKKDSYVAGTLINNGTTTLQDGAYVSGMIANDGILNLSNVSLNTITGSGILNSTLDYTSVKTIGTNTTAQNKLNITSGTFTLSEDAYIDTTDVSSGTSLVIATAITLTGDVNNLGDTTLDNDAKIVGNVYNSGLLTLDTGANIVGEITGTGMVSVADSYTSVGGIVNVPNLEVSADKTLNLSGGVATVTDNTVLNGTNSKIESSKDITLNNLIVNTSKDDYYDYGINKDNTIVQTSENLELTGTISLPANTNLVNFDSTTSKEEASIIDKINVVMNYNSADSLSLEGNDKNTYEGAGEAIYSEQVIFDELNSLSASDIKKSVVTMKPTLEGITSGVISVSKQAIGKVGNHLDVLRASSSDVGISTGDDSFNKNVWGQVYYSNAKQDEKDNLSGYDTKGYGVVFGLDKTFEKSDITTGLALALSSSKIDATNGLSNTEVSSIQVISYTTKEFEKLYLEGILSYAFNKNESKRDITVGSINRTAQSKYNSNLITAKVNVGTNINANNFNINPYIGLTYGVLDSDSYKENGAGNLNLNVEQEKFDILTPSLGLKVSKKFDTGKGFIIPELSAKYSYNMGDEFSVANSTFQGGGNSFKTIGLANDEHVYSVNGGLTYISEDKLSEFKINYDSTKSESYQEDTGSFTLKFKF